MLYARQFRVFGLLKRWFPEPLRRQDKYFFRKTKFLSTPPGEIPAVFRLLNLQIPCRNRPQPYPVSYQQKAE